MNREAIYSALWEKLQIIPGFVTKSRRLQHWADVSEDAQPALFMTHVGETAETTTGAPTRWRIRVDLYIYIRSSANQPTGPIINPLLDAVCNTVNEVHPITGRSLLSVKGVEWCRIEGEIETDEGTLGDQAFAIVPITILAT